MIKTNNLPTKKGILYIDSDGFIHITNEELSHIHDNNYIGCKSYEKIHIDSFEIKEPTYAIINKVTVEIKNKTQLNFINKKINGLFLFLYDEKAYIISATHTQCVGKYCIEGDYINIFKESISQLSLGENIHNAFNLPIIEGYNLGTIDYLKKFNKVLNKTPSIIGYISLSDDYYNNKSVITEKIYSCLKSNNPIKFTRIV